MKRAIRSLYVSVMRGLRAILRPIGLLGWLERRDSLAARWLRSLFAIYDIDDMVRLDLAWWSFPALEEVDAFLAARPGARVFEWGSGASTIWLSKRAGSVTSVESDADWADLVTSRLDCTDNVRLHRVPAQARGTITSAKFGFEGQYFDDYVAAICRESGAFDLIVIDGRAREACLEVALDRLAPGGIILFDDFGRARYRRAVAGHGLPLRELTGLAACLPLPDSTALISKPA